MTRRNRTAETWDKARDAYLAGQTAEAVCARFDLAPSTFHARARAQGWRQCDQPGPDPDISPVLDPDDLRPADPEELLLMAETRMTLAAAAGDPVAAMRWMRFHSAVDAIRTRRAAAAEREVRADNKAAMATLRDINAGARTISASARTALNVARAVVDSGDLESLESVFPADAETVAPNRAERRYLERKARKRR